MEQSGRMSADTDRDRVTIDAMEANRALSGGPAVPATTGRWLAGYRILRVLGEGGMGTVYEAEQESPRRAVALKVVRAGLASRAALRRFELEKEVLGRLEHPHRPHLPGRRRGRGCRGRAAALLRDGAGPGAAAGGV